MDINTVIANFLKPDLLIVVAITTLMVELIFKPLLKQFFSESTTDWLIPVIAVILGSLLTVSYVYGGNWGQYILTGILVGFASIGAYNFPVINQTTKFVSGLVYRKKI